jgi:ribosomal protein S18 acetylase RimI-like enzyme
MIEITEALPESDRTRAGQIYYEAFRRKLQPLVGQPAPTTLVLSAGLDLGMTFGAYVNGELLGIAGLHSQAGIFSHVVLRDSLEHLGLLRGMFAWVVLNLFGLGANCPPGELRIAALAVDARARGKGIGSRLLEAVLDKGRLEGYQAVRLEVVEPNTGARQLYERFGFSLVATHSYPIKESWLGFSRDHVMIKRV